MSDSWPEGVVVRQAEPFARHSPWRVGGVCEHFAVLHRRDTLADGWYALKRDGGAPIVLGAATRTLVREGGLSRPLARLGVEFAQVDTTEETWFVGAAVPVPALLEAWHAAGRTGLEAWSALTGSVGAAVVCDVDLVAEAVVAVEGLVRKKLQRLEVDQLKSASVVTGVWLRSAPSTPASDGLLGWWKPTKRVEPLAELHRAGVAGTRLRDVHLPEQATELLVNAGSASLEDLELLAHSVRDKVKRTSGADLVARVEVIGTKRRS